MEIKNGAEEKDSRKVLKEWEKPFVEELDINAMTLSASNDTSLASDGMTYS